MGRNISLCNHTQPMVDKRSIHIRDTYHRRSLLLPRAPRTGGAWALIIRAQPLLYSTTTLYYPLLLLLDCHLASTTTTILTSGLYLIRSSVIL